MMNFMGRPRWFQRLASPLLNRKVAARHLPFSFAGKGGAEPTNPLTRNPIGIGSDKCSAAPISEALTRSPESHSRMITSSTARVFEPFSAPPALRVHVVTEARA